MGDKGPKGALQPWWEAPFLLPPLSSTSQASPPPAYIPPRSKCSLRGSLLARGSLQTQAGHARPHSCWGVCLAGQGPVSHGPRTPLGGQSLAPQLPLWRCFFCCNVSLAHTVLLKTAFNIFLICPCQCSIPSPPPPQTMEPLGAGVIPGSCWWLPHTRALWPSTLSLKTFGILQAGGKACLLLWDWR